MNNNIEKLKELIDSHNNIVFFGGAGVSTESDIPDFRSATGLFSEKLNRNFSPEQLVSHTFFMRYPEDFFKFYKDKLIYEDAKPNKAHIALSKLEEMGKLNAIITQNIDGLHQMAGSKNVFELHGSIHRNYCLKCGKKYGLDKIIGTEGIPTCDLCGGIVRPDVVLYEEGLDPEILNGSIKNLRKADVLIIGGTSLGVYPAAGLIHEFTGDKIVLINKSVTPADKTADLVIREPIAQVLKEAVLM